MATTTKLVDGKQTLDQQENALNFMEQAAFAKVISYLRKADPLQGDAKPNEAVLEDVPIGQQPGRLHLEAIDEDADAKPVIAAQNKAGRTSVFQGIAFVDGKEQMVLGFR